MGLIRATQPSAYVYRSSKITRSTLRTPSYCRTLWFWGRRSRGWFGADEEVEERLRRHQALMMHRYTKALRRRALWDREDGPGRAPWRLRGRYLEREMSSTKPSAAKMEDPEPKQPHRRNWQEYHNNFESFKKAVDRAIERDPHGTLFGRRLNSHHTTNNSSWTSWSWLFDPKEIKEESKEAASKEGKKDGFVDGQTKDQSANTPVAEAVSRYDAGIYTSGLAHTTSSSRTTTSLGSAPEIMSVESSVKTAEYIYDPISGRKVLKPETAHNAVTTVSPKHSSVSVPVKPFDKIAKADPPKPKSVVFAEQKKPSKGIFETIFGEHNAVDIPVKTFKPPKVYGFTGESSTKSSGESVKKSPKLESSRKHEYNQLRLRTIGNNIDATNFNCEPWNNPVKVNHFQNDADTRAKQPSTSEDSLFSGTAYAHRADELTGRSEWLRKEGFRGQQGMTLPEFNEPPLQRAASDRGPEMEPALDRIKKGASLNANNSETQRLQELERKEDIDLLRASDVRAAAKAARVTKEELEEQKRSERSLLEQDFVIRAEEPQIAKPQSIKSPTSSKKDKDKVQHHIEQYPDGIVARTLRDMGLDLTSRATVPASSDNLRSMQPKHIFSQPTVKSGVARNPTIEKHTMDFEPRIARIRDGVKQVTHSTRKIEQEYDALKVRAQAEISAINETAESPSNLQAQIPKVEQLPVFVAPVVLLMYNKTNQDVDIKQLDNIQSTKLEPNVNPMMALGSLHDPGAFVKHFAQLNKSGYELVKGGRHTLVFAKREQDNLLRKPASARKEVTGNDKIGAHSDTNASKNAATVLDNLPPTTPLPGPSVPTAPPSLWPSRVQEVSRRSKDNTRVSRQEKIFSGQKRLPPHTTALPDPVHFQKQTPTSETFAPESTQEQQNSEPGMFARVRRFLRRTLLTTLALGVGAYGIGAISEALSGRAQIVGSGNEGPMKKLVLQDRPRQIERQRAGIYSTESSR